MAEQEQVHVVQDGGRRDFVKTGAAIIVGGIAATALGGIPPVFADSRGLGRLSMAFVASAAVR
ncbi:MAG: hypothetical protein A2Z18_03470 [Armatimonadetes bacterium RBG_16_58_9]|nr:MAG: hypothetical protein A2Z18_03470 [Armatimonadetes bacterium RBG_16_58_9]